VLPLLPPPLLPPPLLPPPLLPPPLLLRCQWWLSPQCLRRLVCAAGAGCPQPPLR
jgi:hypothetical protein